MTTLTMKNTKAEMFAEIQALQAQLASVTAEWAEAVQLRDEAAKFADDVTEELRQAAKPQAPARPATDRGAVLSTMREFAIANKCPTRLRDGVAQYYSYQVNSWLAI